MNKEHTAKWLTSAIEYFQREQPHATTRWQAEQHQEREKACKAALATVQAANNLIDNSPTGDDDKPYCSDVAGREFDALVATL